MSYTDVQTIALAILTSIITGGFVLVFVEIGNRKNRENDKHEQIMFPFMHKLSAYFRFMSWCSGHIIYPKPVEGYEKDFKALVKDISGYGGRAITSGGDYGVEYFTAEELYKITFDINNIWYYHDKMHPCRLTWDTRMGSDNFISKELKEIDPIYLNENHDVDLVAKVSGEFYTDIYQPIEGETYRHEALQCLYKRQSRLVVVFVCFVLILLGTMLFMKIPTSLLQIAVVLVILMLMSSLLMLAINTRAQIKWCNKIDEFMEKHKPVRKNWETFRACLLKIWKWIGKSINAVFAFLLSKVVIIGLLLSAWAIFSIEIAWIPKISIGADDATVTGINKVFLALSYSYVAGVIIYWFTVKFPGFLHKRKQAPIVKQNIDNIGNCLNNLLIEFCVMDRQNIKNPNLDDLEDCKNLLMNNDWSQNSVTPMNAGKRLLEVFKTDYQSMQSFIDIFMNDYSDVMSTRQLLLIEKIRHSSLGSFLTIGGDMTTDFSVPAKEAIADMFCDIVRNYNELK